MTRTLPRARCAVLLSIVATLAIGCGGDPAPLDVGTGTTDTGSVPVDAPVLDAATSEGTRTTIGAAGGTARSADGAFELIVLPGALTEDTEITITPVATADVPSDIAATEPISTVYSVEPDGLTFGGDGAIVHYHFDTTPPALLRDGRYGLGFPVSRARTGTMAEWQAEPVTEHTQTSGLDVYARLAHLSYQWATIRDQAGDDYFLGVVFDDMHTRRVGDHWNPHIDFQSTRELSTVTIGRFFRPEGAVRVERAFATEYEQRGYQGAIVGAAPDFGDRSFFAGPHAADRPHVAPTTPQFYCKREGEGGVGVEARFFDNLPPGARCETTADCRADHYCSSGRCIRGPYELFVGDPELTRCLAPSGVEVSVLDAIPAVREDATITTSTPPAAEVRVETRGEGTRTVNLADSPWFATFEPAAAPVPAGPSTITATNNGATMTATRDAVTGEYSAIIDDPSLWDADTLTRVLFGSGTSLDVTPTPPLSVAFGPVDGLDTSVTPGQGTRLSVHFPGELRCGIEDVVDMELFRSIIDDFPLDGVLRDALTLLASHCETTIGALTARPFTVEVSRAERVYVEMPGVGGSVRVGRAVTVDGADLLATCGGTRPTYCRDRCVDTTDDPMNCGGCGVVGVETCDGTDDDCDGYVDNGCPTTIVWPVDVSETSPIIGDTMSASTGTGSTRGAVFNPYIGLCGTTSSDGTIRTMVAMLGTMALRRTGSDAFALDLTPADNTACSDTTRAPSGGSVFRAECPTGMVAEGVSGQAPAMGQIGQLTVLCARWGVMRDVTRRWVIRRTESGMSMPAGTGTGMSFSFMPLDHPTTDNPPALRYLRSTYRSSAPMMMPGGVLWFQVGAVSPELR